MIGFVVLQLMVLSNMLEEGENLLFSIDMFDFFKVDGLGLQYQFSFFVY